MTSINKNPKLFLKRLGELICTLGIDLIMWLQFSVYFTASIATIASLILKLFHIPFTLPIILAFIASSPVTLIIAIAAAICSIAALIISVSVYNINWFRKKHALEKLSINLDQEISELSQRLGHDQQYINTTSEAPHIKLAAHFRFNHFIDKVTPYVRGFAGAFAVVAAFLGLMLWSYVLPIILALPIAIGIFLIAIFVVNPIVRSVAQLHLDVDTKHHRLEALKKSVPELVPGLVPELVPELVPGLVPELERNNVPHLQITCPARWSAFEKRCREQIMEDSEIEREELYHQYRPTFQPT